MDTKVTRYRFYRDHGADCCCDLEVRADGDYVEASDYDALAAELTRLRKRVEDADRLATCCEMTNKHGLISLPSAAAIGEAVSTYRAGAK